MHGPSSYLYAPQPGAPAPMLVPVDVTAKGGATKAEKAARNGGDGEELEGLHDKVEGLTFGDDWRDPFMGYLGPQR